MSRLGAAWRREIDQDLHRFGLTEATWRPILMLGMLAPPVRQTDLARALDIEAASLVRLLDVLERQGLIERAADIRDRRSNLISITESGARIYRQVYEACEAISSRLLGAVSAQERALCETVFDRIEQALVKPGKRALVKSGGQAPVRPQGPS
jgi:MarR family transcriptional regulator for hemolysin